MTSLAQCTTMPPFSADQVYAAFATASAEDINRCIRPLVISSLSRECGRLGISISEDLIQDVFLKLVRARPKWDQSRGGAAHWVAVMARAVACNHVRDTMRHARRLVAYAHAQDARPHRGGRFRACERQL